jgi:hypothetical protein
MLIVNFLCSVLERYYPTCNFTDGFGGWGDDKQVAWIIVNSTVKDVGRLTGKQGTFPSQY